MIDFRQYSNNFGKVGIIMELLGEIFIWIAGSAAELIGLRLQKMSMAKLRLKARYLEL